jgi:hypothetical protein
MRCSESVQTTHPTCSDYTGGFSSITAFQTTKTACAAALPFAQSNDVNTKLPGDVAPTKTMNRDKIVKKA